MTNKAYLGIDIGGTSVRGRAVDDSGKVVGGFSFATDLDYDKMLDMLGANVVQAELDLASVAVGVAMSVRGDILSGGGKLISWSGRNLRADLEKMLNVPVSVINDAESATLGESTMRSEDFVFVIWGTGVGCSICRYALGKADVQATELGHMVIDFDSDKDCGCGGFGHLESYVGGGYLEGRFGVPASQMSDDQWTEVLKDLANGLYNIALGNHGLPIVFGGGVAFKQLGTAGRLDELQGYIDELTANGLAPSPSLAIAHYGEDSGMAGAVYLAREIASTKGE